MFACACCQDSPPPQRRRGQNLAETNNNKSSQNNPKSPSKSNPQVRSQTNRGYEPDDRGKQKKSKQTTSPDSVTLQVQQGASQPRQGDKRSQPPKMEAKLGNLVARLEAVTSRLEGSTPSGGGGGAAPAAPVAEGPAAPSVTGFDDILNGPFAEFLGSANEIGGDVQLQCAIVKDAFDAQRQFLVTVSKCKQPSQDVLMSLLTPTSVKIQAVQEFREKNRSSKLFNNLSAVSEGIPALGWVTVSPAPGPYVKEMADAGQFYTNRVLKEFKDTDKNHVTWTRSWAATITQLQAYIKQYHTTGVAWNSQGGDAAAASPTKSAAPAPPPPAAGGPPPPPPPPAVEAPAAVAPSGGEQSGRSQLFSELNRGSDITKSLKKVSDDMKTHKNPSLKLQTPTPYKASTQSSPKPFKPFKKQAVETVAPVKPPKCALEGKKWMVEYQQDNKNILLDDVNMKQTVYIYKCQNSTVQVPGKVNSITIDSCKKVALVFGNVVSSMEVVNSQSIQAQVTGAVHTISIDKTDGIMVYLSKESLTAEIVTAKSSEMNILVPQDDGEFKEFALPEQFKTTWNGQKFVTEKSDIAS